MVMTGTRDVVALIERFRDGGIDVGQLIDDRRVFDRLDANRPEADVLGVDDQTSQRILRVVGGGVRADQVLAALCDLRLRLHEVDRRDVAGIDADLVLTSQLAREIERTLLHIDVGARRLQRPVGLLDGGHRLDDGFAKPQIGAVLIALGDGVLVAGRVDGAILQQRLRERELETGLQRRVEARERVVRGGS
jgi:hypothetical protein